MRRHTYSWLRAPVLDEIKMYGFYIIMWYFIGKLYYKELKKILTNQNKIDSLKTKARDQGIFKEKNGEDHFRDIDLRQSRF